MNLPAFLGPYVQVPLAQARKTFAPLGGASAKLSFAMQKQVQDEWCWAATSSSVCAYYQRPPLQSQCEVASACLGIACCTNPVPGPCNQPYYLDRALGETGNLSGAIISGALSLADIATEIDAGRPICCHISWRGGGGHFNAIYGYDDANQDIDLGDPFYGNQTLPLLSLLSNYQSAGTWDFSYKTS
jgi:hypothetical protein